MGLIALADTGKPAWPQTPDGTTDWEVVFEDPETGFIQLVAQSPSADILRQTTTVVIDKLFTRRGDEVEVERLKNQLESILSQPDDITAKQTGVSGLLRQIKDTRIEKARIYIERKRAGAAIDRRAGLMWKIDFLLKPKVLIPVGLTFIVLLSGLMYAILESTLGPTRAPTVAEAPTTQPPAVSEPSPEPAQPKPEAVKPEKPPAEVKPPKVTPPDATQPEPKPVRIWLKTMRWPLTSMSTKDRPQYYAVILYVKDWDTKIGVCRFVANVMDRLYQGFNRVLPPDRKATAAEIAEMERIAPNILNQIFKAKLVDKVEVVPYGDPRFKTAVRPPYCKSPDKNSVSVESR